MKTRRKVFLVLAICTILLTRDLAASDPIHDPLVLQLQRISDKWIEAFKLPGAIAAVTLPDGTTLTVASGYADKERNFKMLATHRLHSGSSAKTFTAALALALRNEGKVDLDVSISHYAGTEPWFRALPDSDSITLRQLLGMKTGLTAGKEDDLYDPVLLESNWAEYRPRYTYPDIFGFFPTWKRPNLKDGNYIYTDEQYILAGVILEKAAGEKIEEAIQRRFIYPFQLLFTSPSDSRVIAGLAKGYTDSGTRTRGVRAWENDAVMTDGVLDINYGYPFTSGHYFTNPQDLARWVRILYSGKAMPGPYLKDMLTFSKNARVPTTTTDSRELQYGLGVLREDTRFGLTYGHEGGMPGYVTIAVYYPGKDFSIAVQANQRSAGGIPEIRDRLAECVLSFLNQN